MSTIIIILATAFAVITILRSFGLFEINMKPSSVVNVVTEERKSKRKRRFMTKLLGTCSATTELFRGILLTDNTLENHQYYINRLELNTKTLGRPLTPEELRGLFATPLFLSFLLIPLSLFFRPLIFIPVLCLVVFLGYPTYLRQKIADEDSIIDDYFIDLYLLLYSKLRQGSRARLQGTVENYINTLDGQAKTDVSEVMLKLSRYLLNLLSLYEDHVAVPKLRDIYHSATIINF